MQKRIQQLFSPVLRMTLHDIFVWILIRGSMPLTNGSWSGFESGSCYFRHWPSRCQQKLILFKIFSAYYFLKVHFHHFSKIKSQKELQNSRNQGFSYYFWMMIEGSGSIPLTNGSRSERPRNMWIRWIRIRNTGSHLIFASGSGTSALFWTQLRPSRTSFFQ